VGNILKLIHLTYSCFRIRVWLNIDFY
jgi:hypothetical protein